MIICAFKYTSCARLHGVPGSVTGVVGHPVNIPCDLTPPSPGDSPHLILWYKNIFGTPIYSVDMRNGIASASHWRDRSMFGDRVNFVVNAKNSSIMAELQFNRTIPQDAGPYRCRVDFWKAATRNFKIYLQLIQEAKKVEIFDGNNADVTGGVIAARINSTLVLKCKSTGGRPLPTLSWQSSGYHRPLQGNQTVAIGSTITSFVMVHRLQAQDSGTVISCIAHNNELEVSPTASVTLDIILAPVRVEISRTVSSFVAGVSYNITCQVLGSNPPPATSIWIANSELKVFGKTESSDGKMFTTVAEFLPKPEDDGRFISCRAFNKYFPEETLEDQWKISTVYTPVSKLEVKYPQQEGKRNHQLVVNEGNRVVLTCQTKANPLPYDYHWRQNGHRKMVQHTGLPSELVLDPIHREDTGNYSCLAENSQGMGESESISILVHFFPTCLSKKTVEITIAVHESIDLECQMSSSPKDVSFRWQMELLSPEADIKDADKIEVPTSQFTQHSTSSVLTFTPRTPSDFGKVSCSGSNPLGQGDPCVFIIKKRITLPGVRDCRLTIKDNSIFVNCIEEPSPPQSSPALYQFLAELLDVKLDLRTTLMASRPTFQFSSVRPGAVFTLNLYSVDSKTDEDQRLVYTQLITTQPENDGEVRVENLEVEKSKEDEAFDKMIPIVIIFSCIMTVLVFVMIIVTLVKRSTEYCKNASLQTHVAFNKNLDTDIEPDIINHTKAGIHKVYSLDQLNQVSFEGFTPISANLASNSKYNTLPSRQIAIVESLYRKDPSPHLQMPKSILVKKVTFETAPSSSSSAATTPTMELASCVDQSLSSSSSGHYMDMNRICGQLQLNYDPFHDKDSLL